MESFKPEGTSVLQQVKEVEGAERNDEAAAKDARSGDASSNGTEQGSHGMGAEEESWPCWLPASPDTSPGEPLREAHTIYSGPYQI